MPDKRVHRGAHPEDERLFAETNWPKLRSAVHDLSWLFTHGYADKSSLKLVGDRYRLDQRQRIAVMRCACSDQARMRRCQHEVFTDDMCGRMLLLDGYNVLTSVEAALAGGCIFLARDSCFRDVASMHGSYRKVQETVDAINLIGWTIEKLGASECIWYLDAPVSNSGRLKTVITQIAADKIWNWSVEIVQSPDKILIDALDTIASADSVILDRCRSWCNLARHVIEASIATARIVDLSERV